MNTIKFNGKYFPTRTLLIKWGAGTQPISITISNADLHKEIKKTQGEKMPDSIYCCVTNEQFVMPAPQLVAEMNFNWKFVSEVTDPKQVTDKLAREPRDFNNYAGVQENITAAAIKKFDLDFDIKIKNLVDFIIERLGTGKHIEIANFVLKNLDGAPVDVKANGQMIINTTEGIIYKVTVERYDEDEAVVFEEK